MANTITLAKSGSFYQDIVLKFLSKMDKGRLYLTLQTGEQITIGTVNLHRIKSGAFGVFCTFSELLNHARDFVQS